jgi:hypothetical protein
MDGVKLDQHIYLQVAKLSELLAAIIEFASEGLDLLMDNLMRSYIPTLRERLATLVAVVRALPSVTALVSLRNC